jgi:hypothetical protein
VFFEVFFLHSRVTLHHSFRALVSIMCNVRQVLPTETGAASSGAGAGISAPTAERKAAPAQVRLLLYLFHSLNRSVPHTYGQFAFSNQDCCTHSVRETVQLAARLGALSSSSLGGRNDSGLFRSNCLFVFPVALFSRGVDSPSV